MWKNVSSICYFRSVCRTSRTRCFWRRPWNATRTSSHWWRITGTSNGWPLTTLNCCGEPIYCSLSLTQRYRYLFTEREMFPKNKFQHEQSLVLSFILCTALVLSESIWTRRDLIQRFPIVNFFSLYFLYLQNKHCNWISLLWLFCPVGYVARRRVFWGFVDSLHSHGAFHWSLLLSIVGHAACRGVFDWSPLCTVWVQEAWWCSEAARQHQTGTIVPLKISRKPFLLAWLLMPRFWISGDICLIFSQNWTIFLLSLQSSIRFFWYETSVTPIWIC